MNFDRPHRRWNPLLGEWVLVSPHRTQRPWQGQVEREEREALPPYDPRCYLCPGNERAGGERNPPYTSTFVFPNDYPALLPDTENGEAGDPLFRSQAVQGECRVVCFSPRHDLTLADLPPEQIRPVIDTWADQAQELGERYACVQVFENKGAMMGCSNPHPHGQIWAMDALPTLVEKEQAAQAAHLAQYGQDLLGQVLERELVEGTRVVECNEHWAWWVPFWAVWPFETLLAPRRRVGRLPQMDSAEREALADILSKGLRRYDRLFGTRFPYSMGWHAAPGTQEAPDWRLHAHFYPPLLRSATVRKFMVGFELLAEPQRDLTPEAAAASLRVA